MDLALALMADAANTAADGKLNVLGVFDAINSPTFPVTHPSMVLVLRFDAGSVDWDTKQDINIRLINEDGDQMLKVDAALTVPRGSDVANRHRFTSQFQINGLTFKKPGDYAFDIVVNGDRKGQVPLSVRTIDRSSTST
jgi:hypothetical protein